ncbi:hypothetical protein DSO57_1021024 [Entomophthora muscae]|uniref:Uncharacterized protein n=1 Tax=Entomophthora muscae TaxID=34485 RepID=A0ACC2RUR4_9FUNG|nr:hypothetical protein DSO57_1021024 [Entomophthora muscae]
MGATTFVDVKKALLNYVHPSCKLSIALQSGFYGAQTVPELLHHLKSFKEQFGIPFPDYKKSSSFLTSEFKGKSLEKNPSKKSELSTMPSTRNSASNHTCYKCGQLGHLSQDCKLPKANVCHLGHKGSKDNKHTEKEEREEDKEDPKKLLSSQVKKKTLTASSNHPSSTIDPNPNIPDQGNCFLEQEACPEQYLPDKEEINKYLPHWVLAVNAFARNQEIYTESLPSQEAVDTVSILYAEQCSLPYNEVTH